MFSTQALKHFRIIGIFLIVLAIYKARSNYVYVQNAHKVPAILVDNIFQVEPQGPSKVYPKVELNLADGQRVQVVINRPSSEVIYTPGDHLEVVYHGELNQEALNEMYINSWRLLYLSAILLFSLGMGLLGLSYWLTRRQVVRIWD